MTTAWSERKSSLFQNFAKESPPRTFDFVYLDTLPFFFGVNLKRRSNFKFVRTVTMRTSKKINLMIEKKTHLYYLKWRVVQHNTKLLCKYTQTVRISPSVDNVQRKQQEITWNHSDTISIVYFQDTMFMNSKMRSMASQLRCIKFLVRLPNLSITTRARETQNLKRSTVSLPDKYYSRLRVLPARNVSM